MIFFFPNAKFFFRPLISFSFQQFQAWLHQEGNLKKKRKKRNPWHSRREKKSGRIDILFPTLKTVIIGAKETTLERADSIILQLLIFVTVEMEREMFIIFFLSSFCQLLSPRFYARTAVARPDHESSDQPAQKAALSNAVSLIGAGCE